MDRIKLIVKVGRSPPGGGGDCKGISRHTVVPSVNASKQNTNEAIFALMLCQRVAVWVCKAMGVMSGDFGDLGENTEAMDKTTWRVIDVFLVLH